MLLIKIFLNSRMKFAIQIKYLDQLEIEPMEIQKDTAKDRKAEVPYKVCMDNSKSPS